MALPARYPAFAFEEEHGNNGGFFARAIIRACR
jgi:hypothetical protein